MKLLPSRHLAFSPGLVENLYLESSQPLTSKTWEELEKGASHSQLLDEPGAIPPESPALKNLRAVLDSYLEGTKFSGSGVQEALAFLESYCQPTGRVPFPCHFLWTDPKRVFHLSLYYASVYLKSEVREPQAFPLDLSLARKSLGRPERKEELEQQAASLATTQARIRLVKEAFPESARVLILGDDDLMSLAFPESYRVDVFELDEDLLSFLSPRVGDKVQLLHKDLSRGLPSEFHRKYDVVLTDPMYAAEGMDQFLSCCSSALKDENSRLYLSTNPRLLEDPEAFFDGLPRHEFKVENRFENFNRYPMPEDVREETGDGLVGLGYDATLVQALLRLPYLYADLFVLKPSAP